MAKKITKQVSTKARDVNTHKKIYVLAETVTKAALSGKEPIVSVPTRSRSNTIWNKKRGILEMGNATQDRQLFNLNQAKIFMQTLLHSGSIKDLIEADKTLSLRGMFYKGLHTVAGTKEKRSLIRRSPTEFWRTWKFH